MASPEVTLAIIGAVVTHGPDAVKLIAELMDNRKPSAEEIESLFITKNPEEYFDE